MIDSKDYFNLYFFKKSVFMKKITMLFALILIQISFGQALDNDSNNQTNELDLKFLVVLDGSIATLCEKTFDKHTSSTTKNAFSFSQNDTIVLKNGNVLFGEIKKLRSGILTMETPYSDSDFTIDFSDVTEIKVQKSCFIILTQGRRRTGFILPSVPSKFSFKSETHGIEVFNLYQLIFLDEISESFWNRFNGNIDLSYNLTKANNSSQFTIGGGLDYRGAKWISSLNITALDSKQDNAEEIQRTDINAEIQRILPKNWYLLGNLSHLSNTEQALEGRYAIRSGLGRYLVLSNKLSWGLNAGLNYNIENFSDGTLSKESTELYLGTQFLMFDFEDLDLNTNINLFPSLSEKGRWRIDYSLDIKYDLPWDFYIRTGLQFNYDNQAALTGSDFDYIFTTGFGWKFD
mgnify:CR=1 FL=1